MVKLKSSTPKTVEAIYDTFVCENSEWMRPHLGASIIGRPCSRELWYIFRWAMRPQLEGRLLRLFERGNREEDWLAESFNKIPGLIFFPKDPATNEQFRILDCGGHFGGSLDGIGLGFLEAPKTWHLWECKTASDKYSNKLAKEGMRKAKFEHYVQQNIYMHKFRWRFKGKPVRLKRSMYHSVNKNTDHIYQERISYDRKIAEAHIERAGLIINASTPLTRISEDPSWYQCTFCDHRPICHFEQIESLERNCRTCVSSTPKSNGTWTCEVTGGELTVKEQMKGCKKHLFIPHGLMPQQWEIDKVNEARRAITYKRPDGILITDMDADFCIRPEGIEV